MYLFKLQPMYFDQRLWVLSDAFNIISAPVSTVTPEYLWDGDKVAWTPFTAFAVNAAVKRGQHIYYSVKEENTDDPYYNYVGLDLTVFAAYNSAAWRIGKGQESWIKGRGLHDYDCINHISPAATQREGTLELQIKPRAMGDPVAVNAFYASSTEQYLILSGVSADELVVRFYTTGGSLLKTYTVSTAENPKTQKRIMYDVAAATMLYPSLPDRLRDTILFSLPAGWEKIEVKLTNTEMTVPVKLKNIFIGSPYKIGHTQGTELSLGGIDYSRVNYDDWGKMSLIRGKNAKNIKASVHLIGTLAEQEEKVLRLLQSCRATPTIFWAVNKLVTSSYVSSLALIAGLIKSATIDENSYKRKVLDMQIDGMPVDYNP